MIRARHAVLPIVFSASGIFLACSVLLACSKNGPPIPTSNSSTVDEHGTVHVVRVVAAPATVSPEAQKFMSQPRSDADDHISIEENRANAERWQETLARDMQAMYPTTLTRDTIAGVPVRKITPSSIPTEKQNRVLLNVHGGGFQADWGSVAETIPIASLT